MFMRVSQESDLGLDASFSSEKEGMLNIIETLRGFVLVIKTVRNS